MTDYTTTEITALIREYVHNERNREILKRRLIDGRTYEQLAEEFDLSPRQIKNIVYKAEKILFSKLH